MWLWFSSFVLDSRLDSVCCCNHCFIGSVFSMFAKNNEETNLLSLFQQRCWKNRCFEKKILTCDVTLVLKYVQKTKPPSIQWKSPQSAITKNVKTNAFVDKTKWLSGLADFPSWQFIPHSAFGKEVFDQWKVQERASLVQMSICAALW